MNAPPRHASVADHTRQPPQDIEADGAPTWITRGATFVIAITRARAGTVLAVTDIPDEHMVLLPDGAATLCSNGVDHDAPANHLAILPPGDTTVTVRDPGLVVRCFTTRAEALVARAGNAWEYADPRPEVRPLADWPAPVGGFRVSLHDLTKGLGPGDKTRVYRSSNLMINVLRERTEARDTRAMSPHFHEDFEQGSITLRGPHVHHLRVAWGPDMGLWRPDAAVEVASPSVTVIPPPLIHTTRNLGDAPALLVDLFAPPRADFARRPGMVRNAADYPDPPNLKDL
jgi:hypothetical protein